MKTQTKYSLCHEVEIHYKRPLFDTSICISKSTDAITYLREYINPMRIDVKEFVWILLVSNANQLLGISEISSGSSQASLVNLKEILQLVLRSNASGIILAHNHPSGKLKPSKSDIEITKRCKTLLQYLHTTLIDHIIITSESYFSFADEDMMPT